MATERFERMCASDTALTFNMGFSDIQGYIILYKNKPKWQVVRGQMKSEKLKSPS